MPAGTIMHCTARFDNSAGNLSNPDPNATVTWGDQTWEEMMIGYFDMTLVDQDLRQSQAAKFRELAAAGKATLSADVKTVARGVGRSEKSLDDLAAALAPVLPQLDRIDVLEKDGGTLKVVGQTTRRTPKIFARLKSIPRVNLLPQLGKFGAAGDLGPILDAQKLLVSDSLKDRTGWDSQVLSKLYGSAVHVPVQGADKKPRLVSFYSREAAAFPPEAVSLLSELVAAAMEQAK